MTAEELFQDIKQDISFDGVYLWLGNANMGEVSEPCKMQCPIDKELLDSEKRLKLGRIIGEV
jgi:hypothetical protein